MRWFSVTIILGVLLLGISLFGRPVEFSFSDTAGDIAGFIQSPYRVFTNTFSSFKENSTPGETMTLLLLGKAGKGWPAGELTDTIIIARLDGPSRTATLVSIPRDLLIRSGTYYGKINSLWQVGKQTHRTSSFEIQTTLFISPT